MWLRRAFFYVQLAAIVLVPGWIVVASAIGSGPAIASGALDLLIFLSWPALAFSMVVVAGITWARRAVRDSRTLSWLDVASLSIWYLVAIGFGIAVALGSRLGIGLLGGLLALVTLGVFWSAVWQLVQAARRRVKSVLASFDRSAVQVGPYDATRRPASPGSVRIEPPRD